MEILWPTSFLPVNRKTSSWSIRTNDFETYVWVSLSMFGMQGLVCRGNDKD